MSTGKIRDQRPCKTARTVRAWDGQGWIDMAVFDPDNNDVPPVQGGCGHSAKQMSDSANACWYGCGGLLVFAALAGIIALCDWIARLI